MHWLYIFCFAIRDLYNIEQSKRLSSIQFTLLILATRSNAGVILVSFGLRINFLTFCNSDVTILKLQNHKNQTH